MSKSTKSIGASLDASYTTSSIVALVIGLVVVALTMTMIGLFTAFYIQDNSRHHSHSKVLTQLQEEVAELLMSVATGNFSDSNFTIFHESDPLKSFCFNAADISTGSKRLYTAPNDTGTLALLSNIPPIVPPIDAEYFTLTPDTRLINERVLVFQTPTFDSLDLGPGNAFQVELKESGVIPGIYTRATFTIDDKGFVTTANSNEAGNVTCPITFTDKVFAVLNAANPTKILRFDVGGLSPSTIQTLTIQDASGTVAYLSDLESGKFADNVFAVQHFAATSRQVMFDLDSISPFTTQTLVIQDASGTIAYISDIATSFADDAFAILNTGSSTRRAEFEVDGISVATTRTYEFPNMDGELMLEAGAQVLTDKTIRGATNVVDVGYFQTTGLPVNVGSAASPTPLQILIATTPVFATWQTPDARSGTWTPTVVLGPTFIPAVPVLVYASFQVIDNQVFCDVAMSGFRLLFPAETSGTFTMSLPVARLSGNFPPASDLLTGFGLYANSVFRNVGAITVNQNTGTQLLFGRVFSQLISSETIVIHFSYDAA